MPRSYSMALRAEQAEQTRDRILDAALDLYSVQGVGATSIRQVAGRAEVSPGTVLNHFTDADALATAVVDRIMATIDIPSPAIFSGARTRTERVDRLVGELFTFYARTEHWFHLFGEELESVPALRQGEQRFWAAMGVLFAQALGPAIADREMAGAAFGLTNPGTFSALVTSGLTVDEASGVVASSVNSVLDRAMPDTPHPKAHAKKGTR
jgi:AcrR family transcriptional regulator